MRHKTQRQLRPATAMLDQRIRDILRVNREALGLQSPPGLPETDYG